MPNKAVGGGVAGAATVILVWVLGTFAHVEIPPEIASVFTVLISTAMVYLVPHEDA